MIRALSSLFKSRKFLLAISDVIISIGSYFVAKYASPTVADDIKFLILVLQPVIGLVIAGIALEDAALKRAGIHRS